MGIILQKLLYFFLSLIKIIFKWLCEFHFYYKLLSNPELYQLVLAIVISSAIGLAVLKIKLNSHQEYRFGSSTSLKPSPKTFIDKIVIKIAIPAKNDIQGAT